MGGPAASRPGPPPTPNNVVSLRGNPGHRPQRPELKVDPVAPKRPAGLTPKGRAIWDKLSKELTKNALLSQRDEYSLMMCVISAEIALTAYAEMKSGNSLQLTEEDTSHKRTRRSHAVMNFMQAQREFQRWAAEFGLSPATRVSLLGTPSAGSALPVAGAADNDDPDLFT